MASGVTIFCSDILQDGIVQHLLSQQLLELGVLLFQSLQLARIGNVYATELGLVFVEGRFREPMLAADIGHRHSGLVLLKNPMICSSLKRLRFILWSSRWARANFKPD
ncbi:hypothetical protein X765_32105 [Mesorhizobium sp. LSHC440B00]|nr:hypothetical protein X765_32105 [Mesorhizobium sp. LSHC440B00]